MSVIIRKVRTALQREYQKAGGIQIQAAIDQAEANLGTLEVQCLAQIDQAIEVIADMTADPLRRPSNEDLLQIHALINDMLGSCAAAKIEGLVPTLYAVAHLVAQLLATESWRDGTMTPAVNLLRLVRRGAVDADDLGVLVLGIEQCAARIGGYNALLPEL